jgi:hypothetical protein
MAAGQPSASAEIRDLVNGYRISQAIRVATVLEIPDLLAAGPRTSDELAMMTAAHPDSLYRLLRALAAVGVFAEEDGHRFRQTPASDCLRRDAPTSMAGWALFAAGTSQWRTWSDLEYSVRTGRNAFQHVFGVESWTYRQQHPAINAEFDLAMSSIANLVIGSLLPAFDFGRFATVVDVGGGNGALLAAVLGAYPAMRGVVMDQPHVVAGSHAVLEGAGVADRCEVVPGDFFESVPEGGDAYILKSIIHDWEDREAIEILRTCRRAMREGTALLVIERDLGQPNAMPESKFSDLNMLLGPGGRERSTEDYTRLFAEAGFGFVGFTPSATGFGVFEGVAR